MRTSVAGAREAITSRLWPIPTAAVVVALVLGVALPDLDASVDTELSARVSDLLFGGDADAARSLLGVIASSLITVTALTFSLTVVTLQLASSQFSPRLLRTFTSDAFVQATLGVFLATFTYALTVLRAVRSAGDEGQSEVVPQISVTLAFVLAVISVLTLVLFLAHLSQQIRVETMLKDVHDNTAGAMRTILGEPGASATPAVGPHPPDAAHRLLAAESGFLTAVRRDQLLAVATDEDVVVSLDVHPGDFLVRGTVVGLAWSTGPSGLDEDSAHRLVTAAARCLSIGPEPTASEDVGYGLRQLVDVATKALSPGINDPTTAVHALHHLAALLCALTEYDLTTEVLRDEGEQIRVLLPRPDLEAYIDLALSQPRRYGAADPQVLGTIYQALLSLSQLARPVHRPALRRQLERLRTTADAQHFDTVEAAALAALGRRVEQNLTGS